MLAEAVGRAERLLDTSRTSEFVLCWLMEDASGGGCDAKEDRVLPDGSPGESRLENDEEGCGRAPPGLLMRLFRRSARYAAGS